MSLSSRKILLLRDDYLTSLSTRLFEQIYLVFILTDSTASELNHSERRSPDGSFNQSCHNHHKRELPRIQLRDPRELTRRLFHWCDST